MGRGEFWCDAMMTVEMKRSLPTVLGGTVGEFLADRQGLPDLLGALLEMLIVLHSDLSKLAEDGTDCDGEPIGDGELIHHDLCRAEALILKAGGRIEW